MLLPYWDRSGVAHELEPPPQSYHDWLQGDDIPTDHQRLHNAVQEQLGSTLIKTACRAMYMNLTLDATLDNGTSVILRQRHTYPLDPVKEIWSSTKFHNEIKLLQWLRKRTKIPLPTILAVGPYYTIQEKLPGSTLAYHWHHLSEPAKDHFIFAYVAILSQLFHLQAPHGIGSASFDDVSGSNTLAVGPLLAANPSYSTPKVIDTISGYVGFLFSVKREAIKEMKPEDIQRAESTLSFIERKVTSVTQTISDSTLLRCVLTHADPHGYNILVDDDGNITGLLDWEFNYIQPAILAIDYPLWLSNEGRLDPRFASDSQWWEESPSERQRLCTLFEQTIEEHNPELYNCFIQGHILRAAVGWLLDTLPDPGLDRVMAWARATFED
ncbi:kinase-like domain-containing protein [Gymnopilus junonius]|uniref:Kinase-like domain-containing protein n=1 Tax=Gymnopilus junonius TaxID=109634 RepID=A0A9P5NMK7_GYMJU|nr:kinase-like domain-containing protein [Gymnopilus junonius]